MSDYRAALLSGSDALGIPLSDRQCDQLLAYHALLVKWNRAYNLTAVRDPSEMIARHLLDSLSIAPPLQQQLRYLADTAPLLLDVGSGAGLPGIPLAIFYPHYQITLLDSNGKKTRFLHQVCQELPLSNVTVAHSRVEDHAAPRQAGYDGILSRAFATLAQIIASSEHLLAVNGVFLAMKGQYPAQELSQLAKSFNVLAAERLQVPGAEAERHLVVIARAADSRHTESAAQTINGE